MHITYSGSALLQMLTNLVGATAPFNGAKLMLVEGPSPVLPTTDFSELIPAGYDGYADSAAVAWLTPHLDPTGDAVVRDMFYDGHPRAEPGAIVCRVAPSFIRFGNFEILVILFTCKCV